jgi:hypothetical protein
MLNVTYRKGSELIPQDTLTCNVNTYTVVKFKHIDTKNNTWTRKCVKIDSIAFFVLDKEKGWREKMKKNPLSG